MPKDASLDLFLGLYVQVWCLQLLKERARGALLTPCVLALAAAVAFAGAALVRRRHKHEARKAVAAAGLDFGEFTQLARTYPLLLYPAFRLQVGRSGVGARARLRR